MELRPYQREAKEKIIDGWKSGLKSLLLVLPTGCGKTVVFAHVCEELLMADTGLPKEDHILILAHRGELLEQAMDKIRCCTDIECALEKAQSTSLGEEQKNKPIVVASVQTMSRQSRLKKFSKDYFTTIVVDEAHHAVADGYKKVLEYFDQAKVLGVTATPSRGDKKNLDELFQKVVYEYAIQEAIEDKYLCPLNAQTIPLEINMNKVRTLAGDFKTSDIGNAIDPYLNQIADKLNVYCKGRKTVVFLPLIKTARKFCAMLNQEKYKNLNAVEINGMSSDREQVLREFADGKYNVLCNTMLLTEGWDCPSVNCVVVLRPTKVRGLYQQMIGRGTRICDGKTDLLILDFLWLTQKHDLCHPASLVTDSQEVADKMTSALKKSGKVLDLSQLEKEVESDLASEREQALANELIFANLAHKRLLPYVAFAFSCGLDSLLSYTPILEWEQTPVTKEQSKLLRENFISSQGITCAGLADKILTVIERRKHTNMSTVKQIKTLISFGFHSAGQWSFNQAHDTMDLISRRGWCVPENIDPRTYEPPVHECKKTSKQFFAEIQRALLAADLEKKKRKPTPKQIHVLERHGFEKVDEWSFAEASAVITFLSSHLWELPKNLKPEEYQPVFRREDSNNPEPGTEDKQDCSAPKDDDTPPLFQLAQGLSQS